MLTWYLLVCGFLPVKPLLEMQNWIPANLRLDTHLKLWQEKTHQNVETLLNFSYHTFIVLVVETEFIEFLLTGRLQKLVLLYVGCYLQSVFPALKVNKAVAWKPVGVCYFGQ